MQMSIMVCSPELRHHKWKKREVNLSGLEENDKDYLNN